MNVCIYIYIYFFFAFYTEIKDGCQKWRENDFWEKSPVHSVDTLWVKNFVEISLSGTVPEINVFFCIYAEIQDGCQNWQGKQFSRKLADPLWIKNFVKIALSGTVSEINVFLCFTQKFKMAWRENHFLKKVAITLS